MEKTKQGFIDKLTEQVMKISEPLAKLSGLPSIAAIQDGLVACGGEQRQGSASVFDTLRG